LDNPNRALTLAEHVRKAHLETELRRKKQEEIKKLQKRQKEVERAANIFIKNEQNDFIENYAIRQAGYNKKIEMAKKDIYQYVDPNKSLAKEQRARDEASRLNNENKCIKTEYLSR
jgi:hypothetical protein